jgi:hypothetical protein
MRKLISRILHISIASLMGIVTILPSPQLVNALAGKPTVTILSESRDIFFISNPDSPTVSTGEDALIAQTDATAKILATEAYIQLPISFIFNQGQVDDQIEYYIQLQDVS